MSEFNHTTSDEARASAEAQGFTVKIPTNTELFVDVDSDESLSRFMSTISLIDDVNRWVTTPSKSGLPHRHIVVTLNRTVTHLERIALQAILGSDNRREAHSMIRLNNGDLHPTVFFEKE